MGEIISASVDPDPPLSVTHVVPAERVCSSHFSFCLISSLEVIRLNCRYISNVQDVSEQQNLLNRTD